MNDENMFESIQVISNDLSKMNNHHFPDMHLPLFPHTCYSVNLCNSPKLASGIQTCRADPCWKIHENNMLFTNIHTCMHAYIQTDIHTYIRAYIRTYIHTGIHAYMYVYNIDSGFPMLFHPNTLNPHFSPCLTAPCDPRGRGRRGRGLKPHGAALLGSTGCPPGHALCDLALWWLGDGADDILWPILMGCIVSIRIHIWVCLFWFGLFWFVLFLFCFCCLCLLFVCSFVCLCVCLFVCLRSYGRNW